MSVMRAKFKNVFNKSCNKYENAPGHASHGATRGGVLTAIALYASILLFFL